MKTIPVSGTIQPVSFYEDDTIDTVRQIIALHVNSHPDRLFLEVKASLPKEYYATNPLHWTNLFLRLSMDGRRITQDRMKVYLEQIRVGTGVSPRDITREEWEDHPEDLQPLFDPDTDFEEWRILGVENSFVLPLPPKEIPNLAASSRPIPQTQSLYESLHPYEVTEIRATVVPTTATPTILLNYYPRLKSDTPNTIENLRNSIQSSQAQLQRLLDLDTPKHETVSIVRAKWYIPLISTEITAPRTRFEQIFYGMTVSPETPYIGYFTAKTETMRHKFFCPDPKQKKPLLDTSMWKGWFNNTQPQRRLPTLLLYRGSSRAEFDRIAVTDRDITVDIRRDKDSKKTLEELKADALEWMKTLDALTPFLKMTDIDASRWELSDLSVLATYSKEIREFDMLRFPCLQTLFGFQNESFRLLRTEHTTDDITPRELQALQVLNQEDAVQSPEYLAEQLGIPMEEAAELLTSVTARAEEINLEKSLRAYPTIKFSNKEVIIKFVTNLERTLKYVDILRHVLTSESEAVDSVCPRRMEKIVPKVAVPQQEIQMEGEIDADDDFNALMGFGADEEAPVPVEEVAEVVGTTTKSKKVKVQSRAQGTYNVFNNRLQKFDPATFDKSIYPSKCDKPKQAIVLTAEDKSRVGPDYDYAGVAENEKLELKDPDGTVICPPYWCIRDEIPLRDDQLVAKEDGELHCPVCDGKVRTTDDLDTLEYTVIKRDTSAKYPDYIKSLSTINKRKIPCCFQTPRSSTEILAPKEEATYVLDSSSTNVPGLRFAYMPDELAERIGVQTNYAKTVKKGRIGSGESDIFRVGLGRPSKTLPTLLNDKTPIPRPREAKDNLLQCSFFRTWKDRKEGDNQIDRIVNSIDAAYQKGELGMLEELEYVTTFLKCEVIRVDISSGQVVCGFWSDTGGATSRTIALLDNTILAQVSRVKDKKAYKSEFTTDLRKPAFKQTLPILRDRHIRACSVNVPVLADAIAELQMKNETQYEVILDPFNRIQAVFVPNKVLLPIQPTNAKPDAGVRVREGYADIQPDELPTGDVVKAFLQDTKHAKFKLQTELQDVDGKVVELELTSGFRVPIVPEEPSEKAVPREVIETIQAVDESMLVDGEPNKEDIKLAQEITYASEIYEFLMFSLSKSIAVDSSGSALEPENANLRWAIQSKSTTLYKELSKWFKSEAYEDSTKSPVEFVSKVRTPCGQFTDKDKCNKSSLCGWHKNTCKIRVKPVVEKEAVLKRMVKTLRDNDKQRSLVLDGRLSPFFSTVLYLEMPNELITTSV